MTEKAILYDATRCTACRGCQIACKQWNENNEEWKTGRATKTANLGSYENPPDLSPQTWLKLKFTEVERGGKVDWLFTRQSCMHCTNAACIKVCPTGSLYRHELGFVGYDKSTCSGCGYCVDFCPFHVPKATRNTVTGVARADKCTLCTTPALDRLAEGQVPACVKTCPPQALVFGDRALLLAQGKTRVEELKSKGFSNAYLYGERELNGLHVMYVLNDAPEVYRLPAKPEVPAAALAWKDVVQPLGWAVVGLAGLGLMVNYVVARKAKIENGDLVEK